MLEPPHRGRDLGDEPFVVADQHHRAPGGGVIANQLAHHGGGRGVQGGGRFVQQQHLWFDGQGAGQAHSLRLTAGQFRAAAVPEHRRQSRPHQQGSDLLVGQAGAGDAEFVGDGVGEQERMLGNQSDAAAQLQDVEPGDRGAVEQDPAPVGLGEPVEQPQQGGLPGPAGPDHRRTLTTGKRRIDIDEHRRAAMTDAELIQGDGGHGVSCAGQAGSRPRRVARR